MTCNTCIDKLAHKLVTNHKGLDWIRALELADKGVARFEARTGNPTDYVQNCTEQGSCVCEFDEEFGRCAIFTNNCNCDCPPPLPNSHEIANHCGTSAPRCGAPILCPCTCTAPSCTGTCDYDCDEGYEWNGSACVPEITEIPRFVEKIDVTDRHLT